MIKYPNEDIINADDAGKRRRPFFLLYDTDLPFPTINSFRVLIVDDSPTLRNSLKKGLTTMGATVSEASDGCQGLEMVRSEDFDLIITDVDMPRLDGFAFCEEVKSRIGISTPIIILSSREREEDIERGFKVGASGYVLKSNARTELLDRIREELNRNLLLKGKTILIVDDSAVTRNIIEKALNSSGFNVLHAENGKQALEVLGDKIPDLILCDLNMPEMDGFGLCKRIRADLRLSDTPFIIMSSDGDRSTMRRLLQYGASAYLVKPFNINELVVTAERVLSDHFRRILREKERLESERKIIIGSITSLVLALEARDRYTRGHSDSVASIVADMAREIGFDDERTEQIRIAGKLHDLGKIGIRDDILLKSGPLNDDEWKILKLHPGMGAEILGPISSLREIIPAVKSHHERIDGKGYPDGLKNSQIPLWARMVAVADTYDALTSDRPYREGFSHDVALQIIEDGKGTQLCPECVQIFIKSIDTKMRD